VGAAGTMAALATAVSLGMRVAEKVLRLSRMAGAAGLRPDVRVFALGTKRLGPKQARKEE